MKQKKRKKTSVVKKVFLTMVLILTGIAVIGGIIVGVIAVGTDSRADMEMMEMMRSSRTTRLYAPDDSVDRAHLTLDNYIPIETDILFGNENMIWASTNEIPLILSRAFIAVEDANFYHHSGVEWGRTAYAALNQIFRFRPRFGGSTITQQLIKNVHGDREISVVRKVKEIVRAMRLEREYSKDEILTYYLNIVPMGNGCVGVKSAARYYFNKELSELTTAECASLAAITNAPSKYDPITCPENNIKRRNLVLSLMYNEGYLSNEEYETNKGTALSLDVSDPIYTDRTHNWYIETVISDVIADLMEELQISEGAAKTMLWHGGMEIYTLMDTKVQGVLDDILTDDARFADTTGEHPQVGVTVCDPATGDLLGVIGGVGKKEGARLFNRATEGYYQPGSVLKPLALYGPAIEKDLIHYATVFEDLPRGTDTEYWPHNSPDLYMGRVGAHEALAKSKNTVAVELLSLLGREYVYAHLQDAIGLTGLTAGHGVSDLSDAPLALGQLSYGVTVREMTNAYASFANGGNRVKSRSYLVVFNAKGEPVLKNEPERARIWSEETAYILTRMLCEVVETGTGRRITLKEVVDTAGKTGTSGAERDKWFVGYTPYYVTGLHLAHDDRISLSSAEKRHLALWDEVMQRLHENLLYDDGLSRSFSMPEGVIEAEYCIDSGCIPTDACHSELRGDRTARGYFKISCLPIEACTTHISAHYDMMTGEYLYGVGLKSTDINFYVMSIPGRPKVADIVPQDTPYTMEYLAHDRESESAGKDTE